MYQINNNKLLNKSMTFQYNIYFIIYKVNQYSFEISRITNKYYIQDDNIRDEKEG